MKKVNRVILVSCVFLSVLGCENLEFKEEGALPEGTNGKASNAKIYKFGVTTDGPGDKSRGVKFKAAREVEKGVYTSIRALTVPEGATQVVFYFSKKQYKFGKSVSVEVSYNDGKKESFSKGRVFDLENQIQVELSHIDNQFVNGNKRSKVKVSLCDETKKCQVLNVEFRRPPHVRSEFTRLTKESEYLSMKSIVIEGLHYKLLGYFKIYNENISGHIIKYRAGLVSVDVRRRVSRTVVRQKGCWSELSLKSETDRIGHGTLIPLTKDRDSHIDESSDSEVETAFTVPAKDYVAIGLYGRLSDIRKLNWDTFLPKNSYELVPNGCGPKKCVPHSKEWNQVIYKTKKVTGPRDASLYVETRLLIQAKFNDEEFKQVSKEYEFILSEKESTFSALDNETPTQVVDKFPSYISGTSEDCGDTTLPGRPGREY